MGLSEISTATLICKRHVINLDINIAYLDGNIQDKPWWRHQMETFSALLAICAGNSSVTGEFSTQRPVTRSFGVFFDLRLNKWINGWVNNREAGDLRHHRTHYDVFVMLVNTMAADALAPTLSSTRKDFNYLRYLSIVKCQKLCFSMYHVINSRRQVLIVNCATVRVNSALWWKGDSIWIYNWNELLVLSLFVYVRDVHVVLLTGGQGSQHWRGAWRHQAIN